MLRSRFWQRLDYVFILAIAGLVVYGLVMVHSATCASSCTRLFPPTSWAARQAVYVAFGIIAMVVAATINYRVYRTFAYFGYFVSLGLLVVVLLVGRGDVEYGARRWIPLGFFDFQPSEIAKVCLVLALARFLSDRQGQLRFGRALFSVLLPIPPLALIYLQPDLGTSMAFIAIWLGMVITAGIRPIHLGLLMLGGALASPGGWFLLRDYQRARLATFFATLANSEADPFGEGYNIIQSRISIGSGLMDGRGWLRGTQTQLDYLRVKQSDFIFSVLAEEMGFLGAAVLLLLFIVLLFRIVRIADKARDDFGRLTAIGMATLILFQVFVNLGANLTLLPVTGVPLPLISFGGSAMIALFIGFGVLTSILIRSGRRVLTWSG